MDEHDDDSALEGRGYNCQPLNVSSEGHTGGSFKPSANTFHSIDDQMPSLANHVAKIRLDDVKQGRNPSAPDKSERATAELVLDQRTRMILLSMINKGLVSEIHGAISTGKEANVYGAVREPDDGSEAAPLQRAVKIYKTSILVFKDRERYVSGEHRFKGGADKSNNHKMVHQWAMKEFRNLKRIHNGGIPCPEPIVVKDNVLVMDLLGDKNGWAFPRLRDAHITSEDEWRKLYLQALGIMRRLFRVCKLVHADLSEYNILYHDQQLYVIDVSQSVEDTHPLFSEFLRMDIKNVSDFFKRKGVDTLSERASFHFITMHEGPIELAEMAQAIEMEQAAEKLHEDKPTADEDGDEDDEQAQAEKEIDAEVWRHQHLPKTVDELYEIDPDGLLFGQDRVLDWNLVAERLARRKQEGSDETGTEDETTDEGVAFEDSEVDNDRSRGKRHVPLEEKKQHKLAVKEAKREKRKHKLPKYQKKKIVAQTSRKH